MSFTSLYPGNRSKFAQFVSDDGTASGAKNANLDFSGASPTRWSVQVAEGVCTFQDFIVSIEDTGGFTPIKYGAEPALSNGLRFGYTQQGEDVFMDASLSIKNSQDWAKYMFNLEIHDFGAGNNSHINARYTFNRGTGIGPLVLQAGESFFVDFHDNLTGLTGHYFQLRGDLYG